MFFVTSLSFEIFLRCLIPLTTLELSNYPPPPKVGKYGFFSRNMYFLTKWEGQTKNIWFSVTTYGHQFILSLLYDQEPNIFHLAQPESVNNHFIRCLPLFFLECFNLLLFMALSPPEYINSWRDLL